MRLSGLIMMSLLAFLVADCANQSSSSGQNTRRKSSSKASLDQKDKDKDKNKEGGESSADSDDASKKDEFSSSDELLHLAQNLMEKQKSEGDGICQGGACMVE